MVNRLRLTEKLGLTAILLGSLYGCNGEKLNPELKDAQITATFKDGSAEVYCGPGEDIDHSEGNVVEYVTSGNYVVLSFGKVKCKNVEIHELRKLQVKQFIGDDSCYDSWIPDNNSELLMEGLYDDYEKKIWVTKVTQSDPIRDSYWIRGSKTQ